LNAKTQQETQIKLTKGLLDTIILAQLQRESLHGYQLILNIRKGFGVYFGPSTVYPLLGQLEKNGYLQSVWNMSSDRPRKEYSLTAQGKSLLCITETTLIIMCQKIAQQTDMKAQVLVPLVVV
jgi:PadR family transcriptional regulator, regulatory protein PadR